MVVGSIGTAMAESILFPYIANTDANLDTIVTVINVAPSAGAGGAPQLHYRYFTKAAGVANENINPCNEYDFLRPTTQNDVVSFAVGKNAGLGGGNAMFGDPTSYATGVGAPNFGHIHGSGRLGLLTVTTANEGVAGGPDVGVGIGFGPKGAALDGEASLYDIATGAMWGYRALPSVVDAVGAVTLASYGYATPMGFGATFVPLTENLDATIPAQHDVLPKVNIYPPNQFTNRLFVTPLLNASTVAAVAADADMRTVNGKATRVALYGNTGTLGMYDRNEQVVSSGGPIDVRCVGRLGAAELLGGALGPLNPTTGPLYTTGGWAYFDLQDPGAIAVAPAVPAGLAATGHDAAVYELKFGNVTGLTGMVNDGKVLQDWNSSR